ncbi:hypothetical protein [Melittangium boletus]|uniref:hypothetical protein n=1 Tax=Melittangium boletus TaxID=83453 RepID=UPI003DA4A6FE
MRPLPTALLLAAVSSCTACGPDAPTPPPEPRAPLDSIPTVTCTLEARRPLVVYLIDAQGNRFLDEAIIRVWSEDRVLRDTCREGCEVWAPSVAGVGHYFLQAWSSDERWRASGEARVERDACGVITEGVTLTMTAVP